VRDYIDVISFIRDSEASRDLELRYKVSETNYNKGKKEMQDYFESKFTGM